MLQQAIGNSNGSNAAYGLGASGDYNTGYFPPYTFPPYNPGWWGGRCPYCWRCPCCGRGYNQPTWSCCSTNISVSPNPPNLAAYNYAQSVEGRA